MGDEFLFERFGASPSTVMREVKSHRTVREKSLNAAADAECESLAFCCISTGVFAFLQNEAARIAVATVSEWIDWERAHLDVVFNVFTQEDDAIYKSLLA